jgi:hypothetical protein
MLQEFSDDTKTRISSAALSALTEYFSTFIREAIWRSAEMRKHEAKKGGVEGGTVFLEVSKLCTRGRLPGDIRGRGIESVADKGEQVEDLEKAAPQLLLDF